MRVPFDLCCPELSRESTSSICLQPSRAQSLLILSSEHSSFLCRREGSLLFVPSGLDLSTWPDRVVHLSCCSRCRSDSKCHRIEPAWDLPRLHLFRSLFRERIPARYGARNEFRLCFQHSPGARCRSGPARDTA